MITFPFFLMSLAKGLPILFIFSKNQFLVPLIFNIGFLCFCFIATVIFHDFSPSNFGFLFVLSLVTLGVRLGPLRFLLFPEIRF